MKIYNFGNLIVEADFHYDIMMERSTPYLLCNKSNEKIIVTIPFEAKQILSLKKDNPHLSLPQCEVITSLTQFFLNSLFLNHFLIHASAIVTNGECYILSGASGDGKSTQADLWVKTIPNSFIFSDDRPIINFTPTGAFVYCSPWSKKSRSIKNTYPLKGIAILCKSKKNQIDIVPQNNAASKLLYQYKLRGTDYLKTHHKLQSLIETSNIPIWNAECCLSPKSSLLMYNKMK